MRRHLVGWIGLAAFLAYIAVYTVVLTGAPPIRSDGYSYYVYLPAWFLHHDPTLQKVADDCCGGTFPAFTGIHPWPETGQWVNLHPIGVAMLMMPFFAAAHLLTLWSNFPPDGFSFYYQHAAGLSGVVAFIAGLYFLRRLLSRYFSDGVVAATLITITFGTNLFHYGTFDTTFSHAWAFCLIAAFLDLTDRWLVTPDWPTSQWIAVVAALIVLTRHTNAIYLILLPLAQPRLFWERRNRVAGMAALGALCLAPQLLIYHQATGHWLVSSYVGLGTFDFSSPKILAVLFSVQKGLFFWSPVLLIAAAGALSAHPLVRRWRVAALLIFVFNAYLIGCWSQWQFGASFGHRGFTDGFAIAAIFLAASFEWAATRRAARITMTVVVAGLIVLSLFHMQQYWRGILPMSDTTWTQYRQLFVP